MFSLNPLSYTAISSNQTLFPPLRNVAASGLVSSVGVSVSGYGWGNPSWGGGPWGGNPAGDILAQTANGVLGIIVPGPSIALTGVSAFGFTGTIGEIGFSDVVASGFLGNVSVGQSITLLGVSAFGFTGTIGEIGFSDVVASGFLGNVSVGQSITLLGVSANGNVTSAISFGWTTINDDQSPNWTPITTV